MANLDFNLDEDTIPGEGEGVAEDIQSPTVLPSGTTGLGTQPEHVEKLYRWSDPRQTINICDEILETKEDGESSLGRIGQTVVRQYEIDDNSRSEWKKRTEKAMDLAMQVTTAKTSPWPGSSNVIYPLVTTAAIQFAARAYPGIVQGRDVVKGVVIGDDKGTPWLDARGNPVTGPDGKPLWQIEPGAKQARADRIGQHMSWQLLEEQPEWEEETDKLLIILPIVGCSFRKSLFDNEEDRKADVLVLAENLVINYRAKSLDTAPRITEEFQLYPVEIEESERAGVFLSHEYGLAEGGDGDEDAPHDFLEQHRRLDLDEDGYAEPYIVTVHRQSGKVARILPRFDPEGIVLSGVEKQVRKIEPVQYYTKYDFLPNPEGGIYGVGFGQLLNPINESINTTLNQIFDAGTLQNMGGGFIGRGLSMRSGSIRFRPGEYKVVNTIGSSVRESVVPLQFPGPSPVLFQLLGLLIDAGKEIASNTEVLSGQQSQANVPATTTLALIEQGLKVFTSVYKRIYRSLKSEYDKGYRINRLYLDTESQYRYGDEWRVIRQKDYQDNSGVEPAADPSMVSDLQELGRAEFLKQFMGDPMMDGLEIRRRILRSAKIPEVDKLLVDKMPPDPKVEFAKIKAANDTEKSQAEVIEARAKVVNHLAQAVKYLAEADDKVQEDFRFWMQQQIDLMKSEVEGLNDGGSGAGNGAGGPAASGQGAAGTGVPAVAQPPGNAGVPPVPPGRG